MTQTMNRVARSVTFLLLSCAVAGAQAADPERGEITSEVTELEYTAGPFVVGNPTPVPEVDSSPRCASQLGLTTNDCDFFELTVNLPDGFAAQFPNAELTATLSWPNPAGAPIIPDYDLWLYEGTIDALDGSESSVANAATSANPEVMPIPVRDGQTVYTLVGVPFVPTGESIEVAIRLAPGASSGGGSGGGGSGGSGGGASEVFGGADVPAPDRPRYQNFIPPAGSSAEGSAGEASIGFNPASQRVMFMSVGFPGPIWRLTMPEEVGEPESCEAVWEERSSIWRDVPQVVADPILWTDQETGRTHAANLTVGPNISYAFSDDDGESWTNVGTGLVGADHETVISGPYPEGSPFEQIAQAAGYTDAEGNGHAVYWCSQDGLPATCARSDDGGLIWNPPRVTYTGTQCSNLHGHLRIAPDGTVYLPVPNCGTNQGGSYSLDAGETWTEFTVPGTLAAGVGSDPSIAIDDDGKLYYCYINADGRARVTTGELTDNGDLAWSGEHIDLGKAHGVVAAAFPEAVGGDPGRAACGFIGSDAAGDFESLAYPGYWYLFIAHTYDGGESWETVNATPNDPVQGAGGVWLGGGSMLNRNLLDFNEVTIDDEGRVLFGYNDGCVTAGCLANPDNNDFVAHMKVARQTGGKPLREAFDGRFATASAPGRSCLAGSVSSAGTQLTWRVPDHGGSEIAAYRVQRTSLLDGSVTEFTSDRAQYLDAGQTSTDFEYRVFAVNDTGPGEASNAFGSDGQTQEPEDVCTVPGVTIAVDASGDDTPPAPTAADGQGDLQRLLLAEPRDLGDHYVFTMRVDNLETVPPNVQWVASFVDQTSKRWFVAMESDETSAVSFSYGDYNETNPGLQQTIGDADPASGFQASGEINIVIAKALVGGSQPGDALTSISAETFQLVGSSLAGGSLQPIDATSVGSHTLRADNACVVNSSPTATLTATPVVGDAPLEVTFDVTVSDPDQGDTLTYALDFGDETTAATGSTSGDVVHTFTSAGTYTAVLTVTDAAGDSDTDAVTVQVNGEGGGAGSGSEIVAELDSDVTGGNTPLTVMFNASESGYSDPDDGDLVDPRYIFVYGNGERSEPQTSPTKSYTYEAAGTFNARVIVSDSFNNADESDPVVITATAQVIVTSGNGTTAQLVLDNAVGPAPLTVELDGSRSFAADGQEIVEYEFDFGDESGVVTGTDAVVTHTYVTPGEYTPTLTVRDDSGEESVAGAKVTIQQPGPAAPETPEDNRSGGSSGVMGTGSLLWLAGLSLVAIGRRRRRN